MNGNFLIEVLKLIFLLPAILLLIYITLRYGSRYVERFNNSRIIKVYERVPLSQNTFLAVVTVKGKPYLMTNGENGAQILMELDEEILKNYQGGRTVNSDFLLNQLSKLNIRKRKDDDEN